jgi:hypothetical protein
MLVKVALAMEVLQLSEEVSKRNRLDEKTYSGYYCSARFQRCLALSCSLIVLLIFVMELLRSITKDGDILTLVSSINNLVTSKMFLLPNNLSRPEITERLRVASGVGISQSVSP